MASQDLQQALMDAMFAVASKGDNSLQFDRTIECVIEEIKNISTGEYAVRYLDTVIPAYDLTLAGNYKVGKIVYVQVPRNDMSQKKIILGLKSTEATDISYIKLLEERVKKQGMSLEDIYGFTIDTGICGYTHNKFLFTTSKDYGKQDEEFRAYAKEQTSLMISAKFKTSWLEPYLALGNYGLKFNFKTNANEDYSCTLDFSAMTGNPLKYSDYTIVQKLFAINGNDLKQLYSIELFSTDFKTIGEKERKITKENLISYEEADEPIYEIYVKDISISFVKQKDIKGYSVDLLAPNGYYYNQTDNLFLLAALKYDGQTEKIDLSKAKYYWFEKNPLVNVNHEKFSQIGGSGWMPIDNNSQEYKLDEWPSGADSKIYKVVVIYEENRVSDEITVYQGLSEDTLYILQATRKNKEELVLQVVRPDGVSLAELSFRWETENSQKELIPLQSTESFITVNQNDIPYSRNYYCYVLSKEGNLLAVLSYYVNKESTELDYFADFEITNNGVFVYNTLGDLYGNQFGEEPVTTHSIIFKTDLEYSAIKWEFPTNSLILASEPISFENEEDIKKSGYSFTVSKRFDYTKAENNIIQVKLSNIKNGNEIIEELILDCPLQFLKEGDPGTNGTSLSLIVKPYYPGARHDNAITTNYGCYFEYNIYFNGENITNLGYFNRPEFSIPSGYRQNNALQAWKDNNSSGNPIYYGSPSNTYEVPDNVFYVRKLTTILENGIDTEEYINPLEYYNTIFQIKATPTAEGENKGFINSVSALVPVPLSTYNSNTHKDDYTLSVLKYVIYNSDGYNPQYAKINNKHNLYNKIEWFTPNEGNGELEEIKISDIETVYQVKNFSDLFLRDMRGAIIFKNEDETDFFVQPVVFMANAFSQGILSAWDGSSIEINQDGNYILASQVGAGTKDTNNTFTGVLMGQLVSGEDKKYGLYGFKSGLEAFGFKDDGTAFIGLPGAARIEIDGEKGIIQSGNYWAEKNGQLISSGEGMKIDLSSGEIDAYHLKLTSKALSIDSDKNKFLFDIGQLTNNETDDTNETNNGNFKVVGTYNNNSKDLIKINKKSMFLQSANYVSEISGMKINLADGSIDAKNFKIKSNGDATFNGDIEAEGGTIGGWTINEDSLSSGDVYLNSKTGTIQGAILSGVTGNFEGKITSTSGEIGGWIINEDSLSSNNAKSYESLTLNGQQGSICFGGQSSEDIDNLIGLIMMASSSLNIASFKDMHISADNEMSLGAESILINSSLGSGSSTTYFGGTVDFTGATIVGLSGGSGGTATAVFG